MITEEMITEDYVSFETAKLLKEKGFNEIVDHCYDLYSFEFIPHCAKHGGQVNAPTIQMAIKWLEEKYGVFCVIRRHGNSDDGFSYSWNCEGKMGLSIGNGGGFKTATEAREDVIKYCLKNLI